MKMVHNGITQLAPYWFALIFLVSILEFLQKYWFAAAGVLPWSARDHPDSPPRNKSTARDIS